MPNKLHAKVFADGLGGSATALGGWRKSTGIGCPLPREIKAFTITDWRVVQTAEGRPVGHVAAFEGAAITLVGERRGHVGHSHGIPDFGNHLTDGFDEICHHLVFLGCIAAVFLGRLPIGVCGAMKQTSDDTATLGSIALLGDIVVHDNRFVGAPSGFQRTRQHNLH